MNIETSDGSQPPERMSYSTSLVLETKGPHGNIRMDVVGLFTFGEMSRLITQVSCTSKPTTEINVCLDINSGFKRFKLNQKEHFPLGRTVGDSVIAQIDDTEQPYVDIPIGGSLMFTTVTEGLRYSTTYTNLGNGIFGRTVFRPE